MMLVRRAPTIASIAAVVGGLLFAAVLVWAPTVVAVAFASSLVTLFVAAEVLLVLSNRKLRELRAEMEPPEEEGPKVQYRLVGGPGDGDRIDAPPSFVHEFAESVARQIGVDLDQNPKISLALPEYPGGVYVFSDEEADALVWVEHSEEEAEIEAMLDGPHDPFVILRGVPAEVKMAFVRKLLVEVVQQHEWEDHGGEVCVDRRVDCLALLANALDFQGSFFEENAEKFSRWIADYENESSDE